MLKALRDQNRIETAILAGQKPLRCQKLSHLAADPLMAQAIFDEGQVVAVQLVPPQGRISTTLADRGSGASICSQACVAAPSRREV